MPGRYKSFTYEITTDPEFLNEKFVITPELFRQFETLHQKALKGGDKIIERLILLIEKCPQVPHLKNYLSVAYKNTGKMEKAIEVNLWLLKEHPDTEEIFPYLMKARLEAGCKRMEEENKTRISVKTVSYKKAIQRETKPDFINREIDWLYENDLRIEKEKLKIILSLPYSSLVSDLKLILEDTIFRYEYFKRLAEKSEKWQGLLLVLI